MSAFKQPDTIASNTGTHFVEGTESMHVKDELIEALNKTFVFAEGQAGVHDFQKYTMQISEE